MARIKEDDQGFQEHIAAIRASLNETLDNNIPVILAKLNESPVTKCKTVITVNSEYSKKAPSADLTFDTIAIHPKTRDKRRIQGEDPDQQPLPLGAAKELPDDNSRSAIPDEEEGTKPRRRGKKAASND